jgi:hypothetical protein
LGMGCCQTSGMDAVTGWNAEAIIKTTPNGRGVVTVWVLGGAVTRPEWML